MESPIHCHCPGLPQLPQCCCWSLRLQQWPDAQGDVRGEGRVADEELVGEARGLGVGTSCKSSSQRACPLASWLGLTPSLTNSTLQEAQALQVENAAWLIWEDFRVDWLWGWKLICCWTTNHPSLPLRWHSSPNIRLNARAALSNSGEGDFGCGWPVAYVVHGVPLVGMDLPEEMVAHFFERRNIEFIIVVKIVGNL